MTKTIELDAPPYDVVAAEGRVFVSMPTINRLAVIDPLTLTVAGSVPVSGAPRDLDRRNQTFVSIASDWGCDVTSNGKTVWAELAFEHARQVAQGAGITMTGASGTFASGTVKSLTGPPTISSGERGGAGCPVACSFTGGALHASSGGQPSGVGSPPLARQHSATVSGPAVRDVRVADVRDASVVILDVKFRSSDAGCPNRAASCECRYGEILTRPLEDGASGRCHIWSFGCRSPREFPDIADRSPVTSRNSVNKQLR